MDQLPSLPPTHYAVPVFIIVMLLELAVGKIHGSTKFEARDTAVNLMTSVVAGVERVASGVLYGLILMFAYQYRIFDLQFSWPLLFLCFFIDDFMYYVKHRMEHRVRLGWASHVVHHSSQHFNTSTALRQTWTYAFTGLIFLYVPMALIGFHPVMIAFCASLNLVYQFFIHTQTIKKMPNWFEAVMNTPSHHRVHHGSNPKYLDANYAGTFIIWDKMFGTFVPEDDAEPVRFGLVRNLNTFNLLTVEFHEWGGILKDVMQPGIKFMDRLKYVFMPPGWSHDGSRDTSDAIKARDVRLNPHKAGQPGLPKSIDCGESGAKESGIVPAE